MTDCMNKAFCRLDDSPDRSPLRADTLEDSEDMLAEH